MTKVTKKAALLLVLILTFPTLTAHSKEFKNLNTALFQVPRPGGSGGYLTCKYLDDKGIVRLDLRKLGYEGFVSDDAICSDFSEGLLLVSHFEEGGKWCYINSKGKVVIETDFSGWGNGHDAPLGEFKNGIAEVYIDDKYQGYIDKKGKFTKQEKKE